jgi:hypothetical protein
MSLKEEELIGIRVNLSLVNEISELLGWPQNTAVVHAVDQILRNYRDELKKRRK